MKSPQDIRILVACEESQAVCIEFRKLGFEAFSCDILPCSGGHPEWHLQQDVTELLKQQWDAIIAFPPCTHLASSGARYWLEKQKNGQQQEAIAFVKRIWDSCEKVCIENPSGILSTIWRKPSQTVNPYQFGDPYRKRTCLWVKDLPILEYTDVVIPIASWCSGSTRGGLKKDKTRTKSKLPALYNGSCKRSKTFPGIAKAMADQWGEYLLNKHII